jgi:chemotaxis protein methyltransferase CheR
MPVAERFQRTADASLPLAFGDLSDADGRELDHLKSLIRDAVGLHCDGYKESCLRRRIAVRMRACAVHSYGDYRQKLEEDITEREQLLDAITINVSKFFRNAEVWEVLSRDVVPALFALPDPVVRIWSAGCAAGEEPFSLAMLILEHAAAHDLDASRFRILATDIDPRSLAAARQGEYGPFAFSEISPERQARWFEGSGPLRIRDAPRTLVRFRSHDIMTDRFPEGQHLILCRNVIIYFERLMQQRLFEGFAGALAPGGYLGLGKAEALFGESARRFRSVASRERVFRLL